MQVLDAYRQQELDFDSAKREPNLTQSIVKELRQSFMTKDSRLKDSKWN